MRLRVLIAKIWLFEPYGRLLTTRANMNAPINDSFDCSSRKPMRDTLFQSSSLPLSREEIWGRDEVRNNFIGTNNHDVRH